MSLPGESGNLTQTKGTPLGIDNQFLLLVEGANPPANYGVTDLVFKPWRRSIRASSLG
ncbi:MAG TPA: hypothetical protein VGQ41_19545 [Pyrinomonadaceae bacterium]|jgi:hypothetical protein|nr:hypothetical protein [Pyrinomonadaceae bacterium]